MLVALVGHPSAHSRRGQMTSNPYTSLVYSLKQLNKWFAVCTALGEGGNSPRPPHAPKCCSKLSWSHQLLHYITRHLADDCIQSDLHCFLQSRCQVSWHGTLWHGVASKSFTTTTLLFDFLNFYIHAGSRCSLVGAGEACFNGDHLGGVVSAKLSIPSLGGASSKLKVNHQKAMKLIYMKYISIFIYVYIYIYKT